VAVSLNVEGGGVVVESGERDFCEGAERKVELGYPRWMLGALNGLL
jgi:hypothetical protein